MDEFHDKFTTVVHRSNGSDIAVSISYCNTEAGKVSASEIWLGELCVLPIQCTDDGNRFFQSCTENPLFHFGMNIPQSSHSLLA